jgi:hypothetical protein
MRGDDHMSNASPALRRGVLHRFGPDDVSERSPFHSASPKRTQDQILEKARPSLLDALTPTGFDLSPARLPSNIMTDIYGDKTPSPVHVSGLGNTKTST